MRDQWPDNVVDLKQAKHAQSESTAQPDRKAKRWLHIKRLMVIVVLSLLAIGLGSLILLQGDNLAQARTGLDQFSGVLMIWRILLYTAAVIFGPRWLLTPVQQADREIVKKVRWITAIVAIAIEGLLVQKGLAQLIGLLQGGF